MNNVKAFAIVLISVFLLNQPLSPANQVKSVSPEDSLVFITSSTPMGKRAGVGFTIGDGSLIVTAHHIVCEESGSGAHEMAGLVTVFSPYLGDATFARIIITDKQLDLAVLKTSWTGHPSLELADADSITSAGEMEIIGIPAIISNILTDSGSGIPKEFNVERQILPVDYIAVRQNNLRFISLSGMGKLGQGWSGAPMLLPASSRASGCFVRLRGINEREFLTSEGPAMTYVKYLLDKSEQAKSLKPPPSSLDKPKDGKEVFMEFIKCYSYRAAGQFESASKIIEKVISLRPESFYNYGFAASIAEDMRKYEPAEQYFQKALSLNPNDARLKLFYSQFLSDREPNKAFGILKEIWKTNELKPFVALSMFNILVERGEFQKCTDFLQEALKVEPNNSYLWLNLGYCFSNSDKINAAIEAFQKAVELLPERGPFRAQLAQILEKAGKYDDAETHFRKLLGIEPNNPVVHMWLAEFLAKHRPSSIQEALKEAAIALELPEKGGLSKQYIQKFIEKLKSQMKKESD